MIIAGVDEVGRGCLAGPVTAAAVILSNPINDLQDSKKISHELVEDFLENDGNLIDKISLNFSQNWWTFQKFRENNRFFV